METIGSFFNYLFDATPGPDFRYTWPMLILGIALLIGASIFNMHYKKRKKTDIAFKKLFAGVSTQMMTFGILIIVATAIRYENIPYFAMRIWFALIIFVFLYYIYKNIKLYRKKYPTLKANNAKREQGKQSKGKSYSASKKKR